MSPHAPLLGSQVHWLIARSARASCEVGLIGEGSFGSVYEVGMRRGISGVGLKALCVGIPVQFIYMYGERERETERERERGTQRLFLSSSLLFSLVCTWGSTCLRIWSSFENRELGQLVEGLPALCLNSC